MSSRYDGVVKFYSRSFYPPFIRQMEFIVVRFVSMKQLDAEL